MTSDVVLILKLYPIKKFRLLSRKKHNRPMETKNFTYLSSNGLCTLCALVSFVYSPFLACACQNTK